MNTQPSQQNGFFLLDRLPPKWNIVRLKHIARIYAGGTPNREESAFWEGGTIPWINSGEVNQWIITEPSEFITERALRESSARWIPSGSLVLALAGQGKTKGMVARLGIDATCNQSMAAIVPDACMNVEFLQWWLHANYEVIRNLAGGEQRDGLNLEIVGNIPCPKPPKPEQAKLARALQNATDDIDSLLTAKQRLVDLIAEKRTSIITTAVTRGIDGATLMRDSAVPWLKEMPAHWSNKNLRYCCVSIQTGGTPPAKYLDYEGEDGGLDWFTPGDFDESLFLDRSARRVAPAALDADSLRMFPPGAVLVVSIGATLGKVGLLRRRASANQQVNALIPRDNIDSAFLAHQLTVLSDLLRVSANSATLPILNQQRMGDVPVLVPPLKEQKAIAEYLAQELAKLDALRRATELTIRLLKERRAVLIDAAVTGQICLEKSV